MTVPAASSTAAELAALAETVGRSRQRVAGLAEPYLGTEREDIVAAVYEAERQLRGAERALQRALKLLCVILTARGDGPLVEGAVALRCDARRRIPAVAANQVAGTWLIRPILHTDLSDSNGPNRSQAATTGARRPTARRGTRLDGQMSSSTQRPHCGFRASQICRPWRIMRRLNRPRSCPGR